MNRKRNVMLVLLSLILVLSACGNKTVPNGTLSETSSQPTELPPTPTMTPELPKVLTVCTAEDPGNLFRYEGRMSPAKKTVFTAIYADELLFASQPAYGSSEVVRFAADVKPGMNVLNSSGEVTVLKEGTLIFPMAESQLGEPAAWTAAEPARMMQISVEFKLAPGLTWSDGSPLSSADFLLSFAAANELRHPQELWLIERTASLEAPDDATLVWTGIPGFVPVSLAGLILPPLPAAQLGGIDPAEMGSAQAGGEAPMGWGAYRIAERLSGGELRLERNPYFDPAPAYDQVLIKVEPDLQRALSRLQNGACDVLDLSYHLEGQGREVLTDLMETGHLVAENFTLTYQLVFGIQPAAYDGGYSAWTAKRQNYFGDLRTRQAIAGCLSAEPIASEILGARLPEGFSLPQFDSLGTLEQAQALLDEIGWLKDDAQPEGARKASGVENVLDGTSFSVSLLSGSSEMDREVSQAVARRLEQCGIEVSSQALPASELYKPGPEGPLFGRSFDLALISWQPSAAPTCELYRSDAVPNSGNYWIGTNLAGLADAGFDAMCAAVGNAELRQRLAQSADPIAEYLPAIPLMPQISLWAASSRVDLADAEYFGGLRFWSPAIP